ncbi:MAG: hypothetical protein Q8P73_04725 [bacterium]|nr:hypothetical protein [bacterium]
MNSAIIKLLKRKGIITRENDLRVLELENVNPFKNDVIKIYSRIKNKSYIIKKCKQKEIENLKLADQLLRKNNVTDAKVLMPISRADSFFIFEDLGLPLNQNPLMNKELLFEDVVRINNHFLQNGYLWRGLALRNMFYLNKTYFLIDFEKLFKVEDSGIDRRYLLFLKINLFQSFEEDLVEEYVKLLERKYCFSNKARKMDRVEKVGWKTMAYQDRNKFFNYFDQLTIDAEKPLINKDSRPFEVGHFVDELVSARISFTWTLLMYKKRQNSIDDLRVLLGITKKIMAVKKGNQAKFHLASLIVALGDEAGYKKMINTIKEAQKDCSAEIYDDILRSIVKAVCGLVDIDYAEINIIARGSYGEFVLTKESDLDFEIVMFKGNKTYPVIPIENLTCELLAYLGVRSEGTHGRPVEKDVVVNGESRDLFEVFELRLVSGNNKLFLEYLERYKRIVYKDALWKQQTEYEKTRTISTFKSLFEEARFLVTRIALMNNQEVASPEVFEKLKICPDKARLELKSIINDLICIRNSKIEGLGKYELLAGALQDIKTRYKVI